MCFKPRFSGGIAKERCRLFFFCKMGEMASMGGWETDGADGSQRKGREKWRQNFGLRPGDGSIFDTKEGRVGAKSIGNPASRYLYIKRHRRRQSAKSQQRKGRRRLITVAASLGKQPFIASPSRSTCRSRPPPPPANQTQAAAVAQLPGTC